MNSRRYSCQLVHGLVLIGALLVVWPLMAQTYTASPISPSNYGSYPYNFTGLLTVPKKSNLLIEQDGSGAVVKNPRVVFSCAHVVFDNGVVAGAVDPWLNQVNWYLGWASGSPPLFGGQLLRGYYYYVDYATAALSNKDSPQSFSRDFVIHYAYENTAGGGYAGYWDDGVTQLKSNSIKLITGYPSGNYASGDSRKYLMHSTGPFPRALSVVNGDYLLASEVSTGGGNSGGPVWVSDGTQYFFAGVLVSGLERSTGGSTDIAGVYGVDSSTTSLVDLAITAGGGAIAVPIITTQPTSRRVNLGQSATFTVAATGVGLNYRWLSNGVSIAGATNATLTRSNVSVADAGTYQVVVSNAGGETRSAVVSLSVNVPPAITTQPRAQALAIGSNLVLSVVAIGGAGPLTYQWRFNGAPLLNGASNIYTATNIGSGFTGTFDVVISDGVSTVISVPAFITVVAASLPPTITAQPLSQAATVGGSVTLSVTVSGIGPFSYQWSKDGAAIPGGTGVTLTLNSVQSGTSGNYNVTVRNSIGSVISAAAVLTVVPTARLANLSVGATLATGQTLTVGLYVDGGSRNILLRAGGPALGALGFQGFMVDPRLELFQGSTSVFTNDNWDAALATIFPVVGAYGFPVGSKDAAVVRSLSGSYSIQVKGTGPGLVIVEAYDTGSSISPRLTNISALNRSGLGAEALAAGFNITGTGTKRLLIRGVGPTLGKAPFMVDPKIEVFVAGGGPKVAENDNWDPALTNTFASVAAFALTPGSKDAALIATLAPGTYSVRVTGADGGTGDALIEVYELP